MPSIAPSLRPSILPSASAAMVRAIMHQNCAVAAVQPKASSKKPKVRYSAMRVITALMFCAYR